MATATRSTVDAFVLHHSVTPTWEEKSRAELAQWFSDTGFARGYGSNPANWSGLINPHTGDRSYSMAHLAGQRVDERTPDATTEERIAGYRLVPLVADIWDVITYHAGNWDINVRSIGLENLGDFRYTELRDGDKRVIADFWRPQDQGLGGQTSIYGHHEVSTLGTLCPASIIEARDAIVDLINNPPTPAPTPVHIPVVEAPQAGTFERLKDGDGNAITLKLQAKLQPTNVYDVSRGSWDELSTAIIKKLNAGEPFEAVGKYHHPLGSVYFMTAYSFGNADTTGTPDHWYGINTVDLQPAPVPETKPLEEAPVPDAPVDDGSVSVPVKVIPPNPNKWQETYTENGHGSYLSVQEVVIKDIAGLYGDVTLYRGQNVTIAGTFMKDAQSYYRTTTSVKNDNWYGIPFNVNGRAVIIDDDNVFEDILNEQTGLVLKDVGWFKKLVIKLLATIDGFVHKKK